MPPPSTLDQYLGRLAQGASPEITEEVIRLGRNLAAATSALRTLDGLLASEGDAYVLHGLGFVHADLRWLRIACDGMSVDARRAVCARVPAQRRRDVIVAAMKAIRASLDRTGAPAGPDVAALGHATVVGAASILDPVAFEGAIDAILTPGKPGHRRAVPGNPPMRQTPHFDDPPAVWRSFVLGLFEAGRPRPMRADR